MSGKLGFWMCLALVMGNMIGSGIFQLPAALAPYGWGALAGWVVTIAGTLCLAAVFAALARALPRAGGAYAYVEAAFGPVPAFVVAWSYWIGIWSGNAALAVAVISNLSVVAPAFASRPGLGAALAVAIVWVLTLVALRGARASGAVQLVTTVLKLVPLVAVLGVAAVLFGQQGTAALATPVAATLPGIAACVTLTMWAMLGFEAATLPADKVRDPARLIPRVTMIGTAATGTIYLAVSAAMLLFAPAAMLAASPSPFADFARPVVGNGAAAVLAVFAAIAALGALNGWIMLQGELPRAMAGGGVFPRWFGRTTASGVPANAMLVSSALLTALVLANFSKSMNALFVFIILLSTATILIAYLAGALAFLELRRARRLEAPRWLVPVAVAGVGYAGFAITAAGREAIGWGAVLLASGVPVLWAMRRRSAPAAQLSE